MPTTNIRAANIQDPKGETGQIHSAKRGRRASARRVIAPLVLALVAPALVACAAGRGVDATLVARETEPLADHGKDVPPAVVDPFGSLDAVFHEALVETAPSRPIDPSSDEVASSRPGPMAPSPVPRHSREQALQDVAEARSQTSRTLARGHEPVYVIDGLLFDAGSSALRAPVLTLLDRLAERLRLGDLDYVLEIRGHTDASGAPEHNLELGELRARAVRDHLVSVLGLPADRLVTVSFGERLPLLGEEHPERGERDRRVTVRVLQPRVLQPPDA